MATVSDITPETYACLKYLIDKLSAAGLLALEVNRAKIESVEHWQAIPEYVAEWALTQSAIASKQVEAAA